jgi:hypothetical protein
VVLSGRILNLHRDRRVPSSMATDYIQSGSIN